MQRIAVVTGGSRGIGLGIVRRLCQDGFFVVLAASSPKEKYEKTLVELEKQNLSHRYLQMDVSDTKSREQGIEEIIKSYGRIDLLVNNAGIAPKVRKDLLEMEEESFDRMMNMNTKSVMFLSQIVAKQMLTQQPIDGMRGCIINISSISAEVVSLNRGEYCVSKAGVSMLTKLFASRLAGEGIYVYEVRPGVIQTEMTAGVKDVYDARFATGLCPINRWGTPEDIGNAVSVLASGNLKYSTGEAIRIDGGFCIPCL